ncbi:MAG: hypothetical protein DRN65_00355 [Thaumarchaeota archaeon]|nr:MAG: hypothetical protein DRN65_00355 [Nitrososphaerota archaeon]
MSETLSEKIKSLRPGEYVEVLWGDACVYERVTDKMLKQLKPEHLDTPMRSVGKFLGIRSGRLMDYLVLWIGQDEKGHRLAIIPLSLVLDVHPSSGQKPLKKPMISHRFHRLHGKAVKIFGVKKLAEQG